MEVYVIRHTRVNVPEGMCYGQADVGLANTFETETGELQSKLPLFFDCVYSSSLSRCTRLAKVFSPTFIPDDRLKEMHFGKWERKQWNQIPESEIHNWYQDFVHTMAPEGENFKAVYQRLCAFMNDLRLHANNDNILLVCHGGIIRSIWCYLLQIPLENAFKIPVGFSEVLHFHLGKTQNEDFIIAKK